MRSRIVALNCVVISGTRATTTVLPPAPSTSVTSEAVIQVHTSSETTPPAGGTTPVSAPAGGGGHRVAILTSESQPNKISIIPSDQLPNLETTKSIIETKEVTNNNDNNDNDSNEELPEKEEYKIELHKDSKGLGITIAGYVCEKEDLCGIFVKSIIEESVADKSGCIMVNDQITEVNGTSLSGKTNQEAVEILKNTEDIVYLTIVRYLRGLKFEELQEGIKVANVPTPTSPYAQTPVTEEPPKLPLTLTSLVRPYLSLMVCFYFDQLSADAPRFLSCVRRTTADIKTKIFMLPPSGQCLNLTY